ncbi:hypothetical protein [Mycolicibacterium sp. lyk4-40-TYG-92]|nr:hypothetical protein [Mycolicibacterium sp. lyk4-40-TYG-92]
MDTTRRMCRLAEESVATQTAARRLTGLRCGESIVLTVADVEFPAHRI